MRRIFDCNRGGMPGNHALPFVALLSWALAPATGDAATLTITSYLSHVAGPHPAPVALADPQDGTEGELARFVWTYDPEAQPTDGFVFGQPGEIYAGGTASILGADGTPLYDLGSFTAAKLTAHSAVALLRDGGDGMLLIVDADLAPVPGLRLGQLVGPLQVNGNAIVDDYFVRAEDGSVARFWATVGNLVPGATPVPVPMPAMLLGSALAVLGVARRLRRSA